tara:strand:- start:21 stop:620 length:600 start_codon:yes stop_codon:yes gene_type:complete
MSDVSAFDSNTCGMSRRIAGSAIEGTRLTSLESHADARGSFTEVFQAQWATCIDPLQWSVVQSEFNVFRGMHLHLRHDEYFCLLSGECLVGLLDCRSADENKRPWALYELHGSSPTALTFPRGVLHGWYFKSRATHLQAVSESYADYAADDNIGVRWDDPDIPISWPMTEVLLSNAAQGFSSLKGVLDAIHPPDRVSSL